MHFSEKDETENELEVSFSLFGLRDKINNISRVQIIHQSALLKNLLLHYLAS